VRRRPPHDDPEEEEEWMDRVPVNVLFDWMRATALLKQLKQSDEAAQAWSKVLSRNRVQARQLYDDARKVGCECLRKARTRLDMVHCLLWREFFQRITWANTMFNVFVDGSPQWRGTEMIASTIDITSSGWHRRVRLVAVTISRRCMDALSKTFAFLWQLFLVCGPLMATMRCVCNRIISFTTDSGTERLFAEFRDVLPEFIWAIGGRFRQCDRRQLRLFPLALRAQGWRHMWDNLLERGLNMLPWWPPFLKRFFTWEISNIINISNISNISNIV